MRSTVLVLQDHITMALRSSHQGLTPILQSQVVRTVTDGHLLSSMCCPLHFWWNECDGQLVEDDLGCFLPAPLQPVCTRPGCACPPISSLWECDLVDTECGRSKITYADSVGTWSVSYVVLMRKLNFWLLDLSLVCHADVPSHVVRPPIVPVQRSRS